MAYAVPKGLLSRVVPGGRAEVVQAALALARVIAGKSGGRAKEDLLLVHSREHTSRCVV
jgi:hypothetical protein